MAEFERRLTRKLDSLDELDLKRELPGPVGRLGRITEWDGESYINFSSNDYLALSTADGVVDQAEQVLGEFGVGAGGSRLICGDHPLYQQFEQELAEWKGREASLVFGSGYLTNLGVIRAVVTGRDLILHDDLSHRCLIEGARLSEADVMPFQHNSSHHLEQQLKDHRSDYDAVLVLTEGIFSMDGDRAPLEELTSVCQSHDAWILVDEAHSAGVWGEDGAGLSPSLDRPVELSMGTLSKAFGGYGGYVAGSSTLKSYLINRATSLIYSTGLPPSVVGAHLGALRLIRSDDGRRVDLKARIDQLVDGLDDRGIPRADSPTQIVPIITGSTENTVRAGEVFRQENIYAVPIRYPTVPRKLGRVRISLRADHTEKDVDQLLAAIDRLDREDLLKRTDIWETDTSPGSVN